jgi:hypothetical protein
MINSKFNLKINKFNMQKSVTVFLGHRIPLGMLLYFELYICTSRSLAVVNMVCKHCTYIQGVSSIVASFGQGAACMHACIQMYAYGVQMYTYGVQMHAYGVQVEKKEVLFLFAWVPVVKTHRTLLVLFFGLSGMHS